MKRIRFELNGAPREMEVDGSRSLLWVLRSDLGLTGTKYGCGAGLCGSCTVLVDGRPVRACVTFLDDIVGARVTTIEGLERDGKLHPVQEAFAEAGGFQCGFCTPGMVVAAVGFLAKNSSPSRADIAKGLEGHLCRCGAHVRIIEAVERAAKGMKGAQG